MLNVRSRIHHAAMRVFAERGGNAIGVSELAREAGLARGTIYNNIEDPGGLLYAVSVMMSDELTQSVRAHCEAFDDPARRLSDIIRLCVRRVHDEPHWGRFLARYAMAEPKLGEFWGGIPARELRRGLAEGRFVFAPEQVASITASAGGATFGVMTLVLAGHRTWRRAGSDTAELILRSVGIEREEARTIAATELDPLPRMAMFDAA